MEKMLLEGISFEFFDIYEIDSPKSYIEYINSESRNKYNYNYNDWCYLETLKNLLLKIKENNYNNDYIKF